MAGEPTFGSRCETDVDCASVCDGEPDTCVPRCSTLTGTCTSTCTVTTACPREEMLCVYSESAGTECVIECDPSDPDPCAPPGLGCLLGADGTNLCTPGCTQEHDCTDGRVCQRSRTGGTCFRPSARIGTPCRFGGIESDCNASDACLPFDESASPTDGECVFVGCTRTEDCRAGVQLGTVCAAVSVFGREGRACVPECVTDDHCPDGLVCKDIAGGEERGCLRPGD